MWTGFKRVLGEAAILCGPCRVDVPVYHFHIRKTGGTSVNFALLGLTGQPGSEVYQRLVDAPAHALRVSGRTMVGWNRRLIQSGRYDFAFSHLPFHSIDLPKRVFRFTCIRNPISRVISHYTMLRHLQENAIAHPCLAVEGQWLGKGFHDFLRRTPRAELQNQLYMFSRSFDVDEAFENIVGLNTFLVTERLDADLPMLGEQLGLSLTPLHARAASHRYSPSAGELDDLKAELARGIELYRRLVTHRGLRELV